MATKLTHETIRKQLHQREDEGNPSGTYFAVIVLVMLLGFVAPISGSIMGNKCWNRRYCNKARI